MTKSNVNIDLDTLIEKCKAYIKEEKELEKIKNAYKYAYEKHEGQFRKSGEEQIIHLLATAIILTKVYADSSTICAGLLHEVIDSCDVNKEDLEEEFGTDVANFPASVFTFVLSFTSTLKASVTYF